MPSIRNAQRLVDRVRQLGAGSERVKVLLNRVVGPEPDRAEADRDRARLRHPPLVLERLPDGVDGANSGVPLTLTNHSEIAAQFGSFTRQLLGVQDEVKAEPEQRKRAFLGLL